MNTITEAAKKFIATAETWRTDELDVKRRTLADLERQLATAQEKTRTLPVQIGNLRATIARLEAQTAADIAREALETKGGDANATRDARGVRDGESTSSHARSGISPDGLQVMSPSVGEAEGEPYRAGLPPERLRKVWAEWEDEEGDVVTFKDEHYHWSNWRASMPIKRIHDHAWSGLKLKPLGTSWSEVEAMADEAEKPAEPKMLDLTKLPPGTVCEATADIPIIDTPFEIPTGERFTIRTVLQKGVLPVEVHIGGQGDDWWLPDCVPARVVKEGGEDAQG